MFLVTRPHAFLEILKKYYYYYCCCSAMLFYRLQAHQRYCSQLPRIKRSLIIKVFKFICESSTNELGGSSYTDQMLLNTSAVLKWSPFKGSFLDGKLFKLKTMRYPAFANLISQATPTIIIIIITHPPASLLKKTK